MWSLENTTIWSQKKRAFPRSSSQLAPDGCQTPAVYLLTKPLLCDPKRVHCSRGVNWAAHKLWTVNISNMNTQLPSCQGMNHSSIGWHLALTKRMLSCRWFRETSYPTRLRQLEGQKSTHWGSTPDGQLKNPSRFSHTKRTQRKLVPENYRYWQKSKGAMFQWVAEIDLSRPNLMVCDATSVRMMEWDSRCEP